MRRCLGGSVGIAITALSGAPFLVSCSLTASTDLWKPPACIRTTCFRVNSLDGWLSDNPSCVRSFDLRASSFLPPTRLRRPSGHDATVHGVVSPPLADAYLFPSWCVVSVSSRVFARSFGNQSSSPFCIRHAIDHVVLVCFACRWRLVAVARQTRASTNTNTSSDTCRKVRFRHPHEMEFLLFVLDLWEWRDDTPTSGRGCHVGATRSRHVYCRSCTITHESAKKKVTNPYWLA